MKTLTAPITTEKDASQSGWCEVYDIYLREEITTPWGTTSILRLTDLPGGLEFFTPTIDPEPEAEGGSGSSGFAEWLDDAPAAEPVKSGDFSPWLDDAPVINPGAATGGRGTAETYQFWPLKREVINSDAKFANDKLIIHASNVTQEWAQMIAAVDWEGASVIIRKVSITIANPTKDDCIVIFSGQVDRATITVETIQLECSNDLAHFDAQVPREPMHANCRFRWADDQCTQIRFKQAHYKEKTCGAGSTTTLVKSAGLTEDTGANGSYGTELIDPLANTAITASSSGPAGQEPWRVRSSQTGFWGLVNDLDDWGQLSQGYFQIPDAQAGLANYQLRPWIQFDFGSAKTVRLWRFKGRTDVGFDVIPRLLQIFSSTDNVSWKHETNFELPPRLNVFGDCIIHGAQSARYWRVCTRSRWSPSVGFSMFDEIQAYEGSRNWWAAGHISFKSNTATVALRNFRATVRESYSGEVVTTPLPAAPASGDVFTIERGCPRTFNGCCERQNWENFGGFDSMPFETVVR